MRETNLPYIALFALTGHDTATDEEVLASRALRGYKRLLGRYKGENETIYLLPVKTRQDAETIIDLARQYNQETVMFSRPDRSSYLYHINTGQKQEIGSLREIPKTLVDNENNYVYDQYTDSYWVTQ